MFGIIPRRKEKRVERFWPYEPPMELLRREFAPLFERVFGRWPAFAESEGVPPHGPELENAEVMTIPRDMGMQAAARWLDQMHVSGAPGHPAMRRLQSKDRRALLLVYFPTQAPGGKRRGAASLAPAGFSFDTLPTIR